MADLGDFATAQDIHRFIRETVTAELARQRPRSRYAVVTSIDETTRSCMVTFVGEADPVRVPYGSIKPYTIGQEVRIGGTQSDRYIEDIRGTSEAEFRVATQESQMSMRTPILGRWGLEIDQPTGATARVPIAKPLFDPVGGITCNGLGQITIPKSGYYRINLRHGLIGNTTVRDSWSYLVCLPVGGGAQFDMAADSFYARSENGTALGAYSIQINEIVYLNAGDVIYSNVWTNTDSTIFATRTTINVQCLIAMDRYIAPIT